MKIHEQAYCDICMSYQDLESVTVIVNSGVCDDCLEKLNNRQGGGNDIRGDF